MKPLYLVAERSRAAAAALLLSVALLLTSCETVSTSPSTAAPDISARAEVFEIKDVDQAPVAIYQQRPRYPVAMRRGGASGGALIGFVVDTEGKVRAARVIEAGHPDFGTAAVESVSAWKFKPGIKNGRAVNTRMEVPVLFKVQVDS